jgi:hypothetical protein
MEKNAFDQQFLCRRKKMRGNIDRKLALWMEIEEMEIWLSGRKI